MDINEYQVEYKEESINIQSIGSDPSKGKNWNLIKKNGEFYIQLQNKLRLFLSVRNTIDTVLQELHPNPYLPQRIMINNLNDSLFVSSLSTISIHEVIDLEIVYDKKYKIKQIRHQTVWQDYVPNNKHIEYIPIIYHKNIHQFGGKE